jgi:hypothetical protein
MSDMPRTLVPAGGAVALGSMETIGAYLRGLIDAWFRPVAERTYLTSRALAFDVRPIGARRNLPGAVYAFAYRQGRGWRVLYVGSRADHKVDTAIGYGATHLLVSAAPAAADEAWLIAELEPPLNDIGRGGWR